MAVTKVLLALGSVAVTGTGTYLTYDYLNKKEESTDKSSDAENQSLPTQPTDQLGSSDSHSPTDPEIPASPPQEKALAPETKGPGVGEQPAA